MPEETAVGKTGMDYTGIINCSKDRQINNCLRAEAFRRED